MKWTVGAKIGAGFGLALVILLVIGVVSYRNTSELADSSQWVAHTHKVLEDVNGVMSALKDAETGQRGFIITGQEPYLKPYSTSEAGINKQLAELRQLTGDNPRQQSRMERLQPLVDQRYQLFRQTIELRRAGGFPAAQKKVLTGEGKAVMDEIRAVAGEMITEEQSLLVKRSQQEQATVDSTLQTIKWGTALAFLFVLIGGFIITRDIAVPLQSITGIAEKISRGDLSNNIELKRRSDEVGALAQAFGGMTSSLQEMAGIAEKMSGGDMRVQVQPKSELDVVGNSFNRMTNSLRDMAGVAERIADGDLSVSVRPQSENDTLGNAFHRMSKSLGSMANVAERMARGDFSTDVAPQSEKDVLGHAFATMTENLRRVIADIAEAVNVLSASASEISASTSQLASSAGETSSSVAETTATVEEIRQTAQLTSNKARDVSHAAQQVVGVAHSGRVATKETSEGMQQIREQMESIAEGMMRLSEQSQAIGQIIATVDDLAQQSNLLAVNAAIEAAKAGEQGKGFAVVAGEVKSLADQSKQATMQVRAILTDIQKATASAVLATEQGSKAVERGVVQSKQAGEAILSLADSVEDAAQAATQIAATSQQQLVGMDQVAQAMDNIKQASAQNVIGARQLEESARNLTLLGQRLQAQVQQFKTN